MSQNIIQPSTLDLVAQFEGCVLHPYRDAVGVWTIGYGATYDLKGDPVTSNTPPITLQQAHQLLANQLKIYANTVNNVIERTLTQNQFDACVSLCYNIGTGGFAKSTVAKQCNLGNFQAAAKAFLLWNKAGGVVNQNLVARRKDEMALFLS